MNQQDHTLQFSIAALALALSLFTAPASAQCGDCDGNAFVDILDALRAVRADAGLAVMTVQDRARCDVHPTVGVTVLDALFIAQAQVGLRTINGCAPQCTISTPTSGTFSGDTTIGYVLFDAASTPASITPEFSTNGGASFATATMGAGGEAITGRSASPIGAAHTFVWNSAADISGGPLQVVFRITVINAGGNSACATSFMVSNQSLTVVGVNPDRGPAEGGFHVQISGTSFPGNPQVTFDGQAASDVQVLSSMLLTCRVPAAAAGRAGAMVNVSVASGTLVSGFGYAADALGPDLMTIAPTSFVNPLASTSHILFHYDSIINPATVQNSTGAAGVSTAILEASCGRPGFAFVSEDMRWISIRSGAGAWHAAGGCIGQIRVHLVGDAAGGCSSIRDFQGNVIRTSAGGVFGCLSHSYTSPGTPTFFADATPPSLVSTVPAAGSTDVRRGQPIEVIFSERIDWTTVRQSAGGPVSAPTFVIHDMVGGVAMPGRLEFSDSGTMLRWWPDSELAPSNTYEIRVQSGGAGARIEDLAGVGMGAATISFTTGAATGLSVLECSPSEGDTFGGYSVRVIGEYFAPGATVTIDGKPCAGVVRKSRSELEVVAPAASAGAKNVVVTNPDGSSATGVGIFTYRDAMPTDLIKPELLFEFPPAAAAGSTNLPSNSKLVMVFSEPMSTDALASTIGAGQSMEFLGATNSGTVVQSAADPRILVITPTAAFTGATPSFFMIPRSAADPLRGMRDPAGNRLHPAHSDRAFSGIGGGSSGIGLNWTRVAADASAPTIATRVPAAGATAVHPATRITLTLGEPFNPLTVESAFTVTDSIGALTGVLEFNAVTMTSFTFTPARVLSGTVSVNATGVQDLAGNAVGGAAYNFTIGTDSSAPQLTNLTLDGIPDHLNGGAASGGASPGDGTLRMPPSGFTIDLSMVDPGGRISLAQNDFVLTSSTTVGGRAPGTNLASLFPLGYFQAFDASISTAHFLVPPSLPFPSGTTAGTAVTSTITARVRDLAGNLSAPVTFTFDVVEPLVTYDALDGDEDVWHFLFDRDHETTSYSLASWQTTPGDNCCGCSDGEIDFDEDMRGFGLGSIAPFAPNGTAMVAGGGITINQAARNWVINRILYHTYRHYGISVDWSDGNPNPGFASVIDFIPDRSLEGANIRFRYSATSPGAAANRLAFGGFLLNTNGRADFDTQNDRRDHDNGDTCLAPPPVGNDNKGIFCQTTLALEHDGTASSASSAFRQSFDRVTPFTGGSSGLTTPRPVGNHASDALIFDPATDPTLLTGAARARYEEVMIAMDAFAMTQCSTAAHEVGHSLGAIENSAPGIGLYGNLPAAFPGSTTRHIELAGYYSGNGTNVMGPTSGISESLSRFQRFNELFMAYLLGEALVIY